MNSKSLSALRSIQKQLSEDYLQFFEGLRAAYPPNSDIYRRTDSVISRIKRALRLFGRMMGAGGTSATQVELNELTKEVDAINKEKDALAKIARKDNELADKISAVESKTGISESDLSVSSSALEDAVEDRTSELKRQAKEAKRGSLLDQYQRALAGFYVMHGAFSPVFGPYAGAVTGILQSPIVARTLWESVKAPFSYFRNKFGRGDDISSLDGGDDFGISPITSSAAASGYSGGFSISRGLFDFFNKPAFDAKWTKELLRAVTDKAKSDDSVKVGGLIGGLGELVSRAGGGFLPTATSKAWPFLKSAGLLLGKVGGVLAASAFAASQILKAFKAHEESSEQKKEAEKAQRQATEFARRSTTKAWGILQTSPGDETAREALAYSAGISNTDYSKFSDKELYEKARRKVRSELVTQRSVDESRKSMGWLGKGIFYTKQFLNDISGFGKNYADLNILKGELVKAGAIQEIISAYITGQEGSGRGYKPYIFEPNQANAQDNDILKETQAMFAKFIEQQQEFQQQNNLSFRDLVEAFRNAQIIQTKPAGWQGPAGGITRELEQLNKGYIGVREGIN